MGMIVLPRNMKTLPILSFVCSNVQIGSEANIVIAED
jgi:hypothetical protein